MTQRDSTPVAVVTGAARGIGLAIARWFLARGQRVALLDIDAATLDVAGRELALAFPGQVLAIVADVSSPTAVASAADQVDGAFGRVDALVNNAGVAVFKPVAAT